MRSNYKKLGPYITPQNYLNDGMEVTELLGISNQKYFQKSHTNIIGIDLATYRIVRKNQFAFNRATTRNGERISIALRQGDDCIVSPSYRIFKVKDENELLSEYLLMWFKRPEFDRYVRFKSHGSAHEFFEYDQMCEVELPIPSIGKQKEIVKEYNVIQNRIELNKQLIQKLEETAQAIYKQWFVDFEFPDENRQPYKSNGGEMVFNEELDKELPKGWRFIEIQKLIDENILFNNQDGNHGEIHPKSSDFVKTGIPFIMANDINHGTVDLHNCSFISKGQSQKLRIGFSKSGDVLLTHKATMGRVAIVPEIADYIILTPQVTYYRVKDENKITKEFLYCLFTSYEFQTTLIGESEQSTRSYIGITNQRLIEILLPNNELLKAFSNIVKPILSHKELVTTEIGYLRRMSEFLLSKLATIEN